jgi:hypothetical protein
MSNKIVNLVDKARVGDPVAKAVLRKIADQSNDFGGGVWSSHEHIAFCLEWSRQTVSAKCNWLKDEGWLTWENRPGTSNLYQVDLDKLGVKETDTQVSTTPTPGVKEVDTTCKPDGHKSLNSPPVVNSAVGEPAYIDDVNGAPDELAMEWDTFLKGWLHYFPTKTQPRPSNQKLRNKFATRMKDTSWRNNWKNAIKLAASWNWTHKEGWFKADWIVHNDENIHKVLDGTFDFKNRSQQQDQPAKPKGTANPNRRLPPRPKE